MKHKQDYFGYIYEWTNQKNNMKYIGSHYGSVEDSYIGSGVEFTKAYFDDPESFKMKVLEYVLVDDKKLVLRTEEKWLSSVYNIKDDPRYYNMNNEAAGGFGYLTEEHIKKRSDTLKKKHKENGLSEAERKSYERKIQSRLNRISTSGFTRKEQEQHSSYGFQVQVTLPSGENRIYSSCSKATKELEVDIKYALKVCSTKNDFKGYKVIKLRDPIKDCRSNG